MLIVAVFSPADVGLNVIVKALDPPAGTDAGTVPSVNCVVALSVADVMDNGAVPVF